MTSADAPMVLRWRNSPRVAAEMITQQQIGEADHRAWTERVIASTTCRYFVVSHRGNDVGLINLADIDFEHRTTSWGFYIGEDDVSPAVAVGAPRELFEVVFDELGLNRLTSEVLSTNRRVVRLNRALGFVEEGILRSRYVREDGPADVVVLSMLRSEWLARYRPSVKE